MPCQNRLRHSPTKGVNIAVRNTKPPHLLTEPVPQHLWRDMYSTPNVSFLPEINENVSPYAEQLPLAILPCCQVIAQRFFCFLIEEARPPALGPGLAVIRNDHPLLKVNIVDLQAQNLIFPEPRCGIKQE